MIYRPDLSPVLGSNYKKLNLSERFMLSRMVTVSVDSSAVFVVDPTTTITFWG